MDFINKPKKAFTLIELLVVIAIIGVLSTLVIVSLNNSRTSARDAKRLNDLKAMANALELYYANNNSYPQAANFSPGQPLEAGGIVYMSKVPNNPTPRTDGGCPDQEYRYINSGPSYNIVTCLGSPQGELPSGGVVFSTQGTQQLGPMDSLIAYWKFDEAAGSIAYDLSGNNRHGTLTDGAVWETGNNCLSGSCIAFNGSSSYVAIPSIPSNNNDMTLIFYAKFLSANGAFPGILGGSSTGAYNARISSSAVNLRGLAISLSPTIAINADSVIAIVREDQVNARVYNNGNLVGSRNDLDTGEIGWHNKIGGYKSSIFFHGYLDEVRLYNRALSEEEIQALSVL
ncbi:MAG: prepilin-type N-terminal cleavage/methylation domain-containing protein [Patescibacteria group bacterium]|nr:MAG: prepilin-type N-terminal cleavage/methylation domain-containing protein [Patescibacteria group bacterium]